MMPRTVRTVLVIEPKALIPLVRTVHVYTTHKMIKDTINTSERQKQSDDVQTVIR